MQTEQFYQFWKQWFAQPAEAKEPFRRVKQDPCATCGGDRLIFDPQLRACPACNGAGKINRGNWYPPGIESPGYTGKPDPKEYVHVTRRDDGGPLYTEETHRVFTDCWRAACDWMYARGLSTLVNVVQPEDCVLRILHYLPTADGLAGEAHKDFDLLTVNVGGTCPGLEVDEAHTDEWNAGCMGGWLPREGGIHVGEMLEIYTAKHGVDLLKSDPAGDCEMDVTARVPATPHRVRLPPNTERFAAVFFFLPPMDFVLRPGLTAQQYLAEAMRKAGTAGGAK